MPTVRGLSVSLFANAAHAVPMPRTPNEQPFDWNTRGAVTKLIQQHTPSPYKSSVL